MIDFLGRLHHHDGRFPGGWAAGHLHNWIAAKGGKPCFPITTVFYSLVYVVLVLVSSFTLEIYIAVNVVCSSSTGQAAMLSSWTNT